MSGAVVQDAKASATASATSIAVTLGAAITPGNTVVAWVTFTGGTQASVTIGNGTDTLTLQGTVVNDSGTRMARYAKINCTGGGSTTFTWSNSTSLTNRGIWVAECSTIDTSAGVVGGGNPAASAPGAGTDAITTGSIANSAGLTAFHIGIGVDYQADTITIVKGTGATQVGTAGWTDIFGTVNAGAILEYKAGIAASASDSLTFTGGYAGHTYKAASIMLKEAALTSITPSAGALTISGNAPTLSSAFGISVGVHGKTSTDTGSTAVVTLNTRASGSLFELSLVYDGTFTSIADSNSNTWTQVGTEVNQGSFKHRRYRCENAVGGNSHAFTLTTGGTIRTLYVMEVLNAKLSGSLDANPGGLLDSTSPFDSNSTGVLAQTNEIVIAAIGADGGGGFSESNGFTILDQETNSGLYWCGAFAYKIVSSTAAQQASFTQVGATAASVFISSAKEATAGQAGTGSLALTGAAPVVTQGAMRVPTVAALALVGTTVFFFTGGSPVPATGALALAGVAPVVTQGALRTPTAGALTLTGNAPNLGTPGVAMPGTGALAFTGNVSEQTLTVSSPPAGPLTLSGSSPVLLQGTVRAPGVGSLSLFGNQPNIFSNSICSPSTGSLVLTGQFASPQGVNFVIPGAGQLSFAGIAPAVTVPMFLVPNAGQLTLVGLQPIEIFSSPVIIPFTGALLINGQTPTGFGAGGPGSPGPGVSRAGVSAAGVSSGGVSAGGVSG